MLFLKNKNFLKKITASLLSASFCITPIIVSSSCSSNEPQQHEQYSNSILLNDPINNNIYIYIDNDKFDKNSSFSDFEFLDKNAQKQLSIVEDQSKINDKHCLFLLKDKLNTIDTGNGVNILVKNKKYNNYEINIRSIKTFKSYNQHKSEQYFYDFIKDVSSNGIPTILYNVNASLPIQQTFYISLINYFKNIDNQNLNEKTITIADQDIWGNHRFNADVLKEKNIWNGVDNIDEINDSNIGMFNLLRPFSWASGMSESEWSNFFNKVMNKFKIDKFDFVLVDWLFLGMLEEYKNNPTPSSRLGWILKHCNRIMVVTDGAYETDKFLPYMVYNLSKIKVKSQEENIKAINEYQQGKHNLSFEDVLNLLLIKNYEIINDQSKFDFIHMVHYDSNIKNIAMLGDDCMYSETSVSTNFVNYSKLLDIPKAKKQYLDVYPKLFIDQDMNMNKIFINGINSYDPNKRNAIFLGSSLFKPLRGDMTPKNFSRLQNFKNLRGVIQNKMKQLIEQFPPSEYNIIFKLHPVYSSASDPNNEIAINYIKLITNNLIQDPIIVSPKIPLELLIANDYNIYKNNLSNDSLYNFIFKENENYKPYEWTTFFGLQATTTTIQTSRIFYQSTFNLDKETVANLIPFYNFPIPKEYKVVAREDVDINLDYVDYYQDNLNKLQDIYLPYCPSLFFNDESLKVYDSIVLNITK